MSIEQTNVVDFYSIDRKSGEVLLSISDHLPWKKGTREEGEHLFLLQEKINAYLRFTESGEIFERFPNARDRKIVINLVGKYPLSEQATILFRKMKEFLKSAGYELRFEHMPQGEAEKKK